jgi:hypothetical protein
MHGRRGWPDGRDRITERRHRPERTGEHGREQQRHMTAATSRSSG